MLDRVFVNTDAVRWCLL